MSGELKIKEMI